MRLAGGLPAADRGPARKKDESLAIAKLCNNVPMNEDRQRYALHAAVFAALSNPTRHELMHLLCKGGPHPQ